MKTVLVGTRESKLAKWQGNWVISQLEGLFKDYRFQLVGIQTKGDVQSTTPFHKIDGTNIFTKEVDEALINKKIDMAVHSIKDLHNFDDSKIILGSIVGRSEPSDVLISRENIPLRELPEGARIGTSSLRRKSELLRFREDFNIVECRGNIPTRISKVRKKEFDAIVLAAAGLQRLGLDSKITEYLPYSLCMPAAGQGAVGVNIRIGDNEMRYLLREIHNPMAESAVKAERALVDYLGGGCNVPIGALARYKGNRLQLEAIVLSPDGSEAVRSYATGHFTSPTFLGIHVAKMLLKDGAYKIIKEHSSAFNAAPK